MPYPCLTHHGGAQTVTGSCHQLHLDADTSVLIDCGLAQGADAALGQSALGAALDTLQALIVTHVHLDHVGRLPALFAAGYRGPILCSEPSAQLLPLVLEDAYKLTISSDPAEVARYLAFVQALVRPLPFAQWHTLVERQGLTCRVRLQRAGHVLGSAYVECDVHHHATGQRTRVVFSGDLGAPARGLLRAVEPPEHADLLVLESTYGDRLHAPGDRQQALEAVVERALADHGTVFIPAFSLGRTQEVLFDLEAILHRKALCPSTRTALPDDPLSRLDWSQLPIILDSPLAQRITQVYRELHHHWHDDASQRLRDGRAPLGFGQLISIDSHADHARVVNYLKSTGKPAIVIAGNGMCSGGRIVAYLKAMLGDPRHEVVFVGHQVPGTPGAVIQASAGVAGFVRIDLDGQLYDVRAKVFSVPGYSAHADQAGLVEFVTGMSRWPSRIRLVHGEQPARHALAERLRDVYAKKGLPVEIE
ncbi:MBL fold metallo-hydrolase [Pseudomonas entomophila]|uniref:MBL fold metallo-hydrolase RNA specificity domain-containing protein n=1 Tax=Pseudomonas entomophila TaxID=312306 RepID=UPI0015E46571|nr:MBL fold metallo-hydrolase [Pseudomonas entomophila]MBA1190746.1 MBL fold metallo-hydrolase [Pseudomonas entomophila]